MMIKKFLKYPINYLMIIVVIYTVYDYFEHIGRSGSTFEEHPWYWLWFSLSATLSFIFVVYLVKKFLQKIFKQNNVVFEVTAIGVWLVLYLYVIGPLNDWILWPFDELYFNFHFGPFFIVLMGYFIIRILINLSIGKKALYSK